LKGVEKMKIDEFTLYGLSEHKQVIDKILTELNTNQYNFDIRLILTEALTNAFKHGNNMNVNEPIYLRYSYNDSNVKFEIRDSGAGGKNVVVHEELQDENLLLDSGRGLFLIKSLS
jgi:serine/threonine-protein kinase RsbW